MKHLPLEILSKMREKTAAKIIELTNNYNGDEKTYKKLEALYNNLHKICDTMTLKSGTFQGHIFSELGDLPRIFVVDGEPVKYDINTDALASANATKPYYTPEEVTALLQWTVNNTRNNLYLTGPSNDLTGCCGLSQFSSLYPLQKLGLKITINNVSNVHNHMGRHAFGTVTIPTLIGNNVEERQYLIDCTYSQFFHLDRCVKNMYFVDGREPDAGYFVKGFKDEERFASNMIKYGFCEATEENLKKYFYGFYLRNFGKENLDEALLSYNSLNISNIINNSHEEFDYEEAEFDKWGLNLKIGEGFQK